MDALDSLRRDDSIVSKHLSLVKPTNDKSYVEPVVFRLPIELTRIIFGEFRSDIQFRLTLTHICHRWREIAVNDASLWTDIHIDTLGRNSDSCLDYFLSFLGMQLDRTANLLLDVEWFAEIGDEFFIPTLKLLHEKAPFSRWRSFEVGIMGKSSDDDPWSARDAFTNLEFLIIQGKTPSTIISVINCTVTSRLRFLEVTGNCPSAEEVVTCFAKPLTHITSLRLDSLVPHHDKPFLPANVVNLEFATAPQHLFPHIQKYTLRDCIFIGGNTVDLRNMTTLIVRNALTVRSDCHVLLPALRELKLGSLTIKFGGKIEAPVLDILYFMTPSGDLALVARTVWSLQEGYLLSPNTSFIADSYLPSWVIIHLLARSPKVTHATLGFDDWTGAQAVLGNLAGFKAVSDSSSAEDVHLCPRLSELRLDFHWEFSEPSASKEWLLNALKTRRESGLLTSLSIYAGWKGEGTYVLLTGE